MWIAHCGRHCDENKFSDGSNGVFSKSGVGEITFYFLAIVNVMLSYHTGVHFFITFTACSSSTLNLLYPLIAITLVVSHG